MRLALTNSLIASALVLLGLQPVSEIPTKQFDRKSPGRILRIEGMDSRRAGHTMTTLHDGRVLVVGGFTANEARPAGASLFDPSSKLFSAIDDAAAFRHSHTATLLQDGRVLIAGGYGPGGEMLTTTALFDPATDKFVEAGSLPEPLSSQRDVLLADGRVLLLGGMTTGWRYRAAVLGYDPQTNKIDRAGSLLESRGSHTATQLPDGRILVAGGHSGRRRALTILKTAEIYDPETNTAAAVSGLTIRRHKHDAVALPDGDVLIIGGSDERDFDGIYDSIERFDASTASFVPEGSLRLDRFKLRGTTRVLASGAVLVAGGAESVELLDGNLQTTGILPGASDLSGRFSATAVLADGRVLITGGYGTSGGPTNGAWLFVPDNQ